MKSIIKYFLLSCIICTGLLAAGYGWSQNITALPNETTFFPTSPIQGPTMGTTSNSADNNTPASINPQQSSQDYKENQMNLIGDQKALRQNQHELINQNIQDSITNSQNKQKDQMDNSSSNSRQQQIQNNITNSQQSQQTQTDNSKTGQQNVQDNITNSQQKLQIQLDNSHLVK